MHTRLRSPLLTLIVVAATALPCGAQCLQWDDRFSVPGADSSVFAFANFDDGSGPAFYAGGSFTSIGNVNASRIAKWDGVTWSPLGLGVESSSVYALTAFDDGSGSALYVGGWFVRAGGMVVRDIARWDGASWSALGSGVAGASSTVRALIAFDDGSGPALFAGGDFTQIGGVAASGVAKWDGSSWSNVGDISAPVYSFAVHDDGSGAALYAATIGTPAVYKWNGSSSWSFLGGGANGSVHALASFDDGTGLALYAGGAFTSIGGAGANRVAKWTGASWSAVGGGVNASIRALAVYDHGSGPRLHAGGEFTSADGAPAGYTAMWDGTSWSALGAGVNQIETLVPVSALGDFETLADGPILVAGGFFTQAGAVGASNIATWDGGEWSIVAKGMGLGGRGLRLWAIGSFDAGEGAALYVGGNFGSAGPSLAENVAKWDGASWSALGDGVDADVRALTAFDDGSGPALYAGGDFVLAGGVVANHIAKWDGSQWSALGSGMAGGGPTTVDALAVYDDGSGPALFAGGYFSSAGGVGASHIARWNGSTWSSVGGGFNQLGTWPGVLTLTVFDDGSGSALYAGGTFTHAGGQPASRIAKWDGKTWSPLGSGVNPEPVGHISPVRTSTVFRDGIASKLCVGGTFTSVGGVSAKNVAAWDGSSWSAFGPGVFLDVNALIAFDDGFGETLYAGGFNFHASYLQRWNGSGWPTLAGGVSDLVWALGVFEDGADGAPDLYVGGRFAIAGGKASSLVAEFRGCPPGIGYCSGDGLDPAVTVSCPCGNLGSTGHGCANSNSALGGARLIGSGTINPNTIVLTCTGVNNNTLCTFFRGPNHDPQAAVFGDGIKCINPPIFRFGQQNSGQGGNPAFTVVVPAPTELPGSTFHYAVHYRNPVGGFCLPALFNASNGYTIQW